MAQVSSLQVQLTLVPTEASASVVVSCTPPTSSTVWIGSCSFEVPSDWFGVPEVVALLLSVRYQDDSASVVTYPVTPVRLVQPPSWRADLGAALTAAGYSSAGMYLTSELCPVNPCL